MRRVLGLDMCHGSPLRRFTAWRCGASICVPWQPNGSLQRIPPTASLVLTDLLRLVSPFGRSAAKLTEEEQVELVGVADDIESVQRRTLSSGT